jgi:perosamine synthetase
MSESIRSRIQAMSVAASATVADAMGAIDRGELGLALLEGPAGRFAGVVTDGDLRRALLGGLTLDSPLADVRHPEARTAQLDTPFEEVAALFSESVRVLPLLDAEGRVADLAVFDSWTRLPVAEPFLGDEELRYVSECVLTGWVSSAGAFVGRFEELFAERCGVAHAVAVSNGTAALHVALVALGIGPGDEVVVPTLTFIATANAVAYTGATPVFADSEPLTWNVDPEAVAAAITPRTRAIVPVHLYGHPADMDGILEVAAEHRLAVVEDAAEAHGALYRGRPVGSLGDLGTFSFYGNKIVTTGEGGMVVTNDAALAERIRVLRDHGMEPGRRYWHPVLGFNYRLTNVQAAIGVAQLEKLDEILAAKRRVASRYADGLRGVPGLTLPPEEPWARNVHWLYSILVEPEFGVDRDAVMDALDAAGIESRPFFTPLHEQPLYATGERLPVAERIAERGVSLPSAVTLSTSEIDRVVGVISALRGAPEPAPAP